MRIIKKITEQISEELCDAEKYIKCAMNQKSDFPQLADVYYKLSNEELGHANALHDQAVRLIDEWKKKMEKEPPDYMKEMWNEEHDEFIEEMAEIKVMIDMYKK